MSSLVEVTNKSYRNPYAIYDGPRVGDEFLEWNMGDAGVAPKVATLQVLGQLANMGQIDQLFGAATRLFGDAVESIQFKSQVTPTITVVRPFSTAPGQKPAQTVEGGTPVGQVVLDRFAKPAVYIRFAGGTVYPIEPYGAPKDDYTGYIVGGLGLAVGLGMVVGAVAARKVFCP